MDDFCLGVDVSSWQPKVDWKVLYEGGVRFAIIKLSQGNYSYDRFTREHVRGAMEAGLLVGLYHWHDPLCKMWSSIGRIGKNGGSDISPKSWELRQSRCRVISWRVRLRSSLVKRQWFIPGRVSSKNMLQRCKHG